ncbi:hypothetical protein JXB02_03335 [Candidatus Woesearchaeota archaeon]|nr:hypothetical protein [Candidatus Woesearchaeota archaeon]
MEESERIIRSVGPDKGSWKKANDPEGVVAYDRAKRNLERIPKLKESLEERLRQASKWSINRLPSAKDVESGDNIEKHDIGDVTLKVTSFIQINRPAYKSAVDQFRHYLDGIAFLYSEGHAVTEVIKGDDARLYVRAPRARDALMLYVIPLLRAQFKQNVAHSVRGALKKEGSPLELALPESGLASIIEESFYAYARLDKMLKTEKAYYDWTKAGLKKELKRAGTKKATLEASDKVGVEVELAPVVTPSYLGVVATLIRLPHIKDAPLGELDYLASQEQPHDWKAGRFPQYELITRNLPRDGPVTYVSIASMERRVKDLLARDPKEYDRFLARIVLIEEGMTKKEKQ